MQPNSPWTFLNAVNQLTQANLQLWGSASLPQGDGPVVAGVASGANPMAVTMLLMQGMAKNYALFLQQLNTSTFALLAGNRGVLMPIVSGE